MDNDQYIQPYDCDVSARHQSRMVKFSKGEIRDAKFGSPDWLIYNDSFE